MNCCGFIYKIFFPAPSRGYSEESVRNINNSGKLVQLHSYHERSTNRVIPYLFFPFYTSSDKSTVSAECLLYFHGNAEDIGHSISLLNSMRNFLKINVMAMEYPGYGLANHYQRNPHEMKENALGFYKMVNEKLGFPHENIIVFGRSIGSGPASYVAGSNPNVRTLVLMSPISSIRDVAGDHTCKCFACFIENFFDNVQCARNTKANLLVIHGTIDEVVPIRNGVHVVEAYEQRKDRRAEFRQVPTMTHNTFQLQADILIPTRDFIATRRHYLQQSRETVNIVDRMKMLDEEGSQDNFA